MIYTQECTFATSLKNAKVQNTSRYEISPLDVNGLLKEKLLMGDFGRPKTVRC